MIEDLPADKLLKEVNSSGFPLQIAVEQVVKQFPREGKWQVLGTEFPWVDPRSGRQGFVDLVITNGAVAFVIECKRRSGGNWAFLVTPRQTERNHLRCVVTGGSIAGTKCIEWTDFPASPESEHCVVPGAGDNRRSLERIAGELVIATESIASVHSQSPWPLAFVPMIVCVPRPVIVHVDPASVSIDDGTISADAAVEFPRFVRFRKAFGGLPEVESGGRLASEQHSADIRDLLRFAEDRERTVFVVPASGFSDLLSDLWQLANAPPNWAEIVSGW